MADVQRLGGARGRWRVAWVRCRWSIVDIGVHRDGLVHVSELADRYVKDPNEVIRVRQKVRVKVLAVDAERGRISLSMRGVWSAPVAMYCSAGTLTQPSNPARGRPSGRD